MEEVPLTEKQETARKALDALTDEERDQVCGLYCRHTCPLKSLITVYLLFQISKTDI